MHINYRVYTKATKNSPWKFNGVIESNLDNAHKCWTDTIKRLRYHAYKLEPCTYGVPIER